MAEKLCSNKNCLLAGILQPHDNFYRQSKKKHEFFSECKKCNNLRSKSYKNRNPDKIKKYYDEYRLKNAEKYAAYVKSPQRKNVEFKSRYGITLDQRNEMAISQNQQCKICLRNEKLVVDHDHKTAKIRGLLCHACNKSIGLIRDNAITAQRMGDYLLKEGAIDPH